MGIAVTLTQGTALAEVSSPSHPVTVTGALDRGDARVALSPDTPADRDFVLRRRPRVDVVAPAVLARRERGEGFVTLVLHPDATAADDPRVTPREVVFLVDASSSMRGASLERARSLLRSAMGSLQGALYDDGGVRALFQDRLGRVELVVAPFEAASPVSQSISWYLAMEGSGSDDTIVPSCH